MLFSHYLQELVCDFNSFLCPAQLLQISELKLKVRSVFGAFSIVERCVFRSNTKFRLPMVSYPALHRCLFRCPSRSTLEPVHSSNRTLYLTLYFTRYSTLRLTDQFKNRDLRPPAAIPWRISWKLKKNETKFEFEVQNLNHEDKAKQNQKMVNCAFECEISNVQIVVDRKSDSKLGDEQCK